MLRSWKIGQAFGIPVYIHTTFLLAPLMIVLTNDGGNSLFGAMYLVALCLAVFVCVILHEFGHALMARQFGINTRDITIYPIGGVARLEGMSEKPNEEILIAVAGPAVNVVIAVLLAPVVILAYVLGGLSLNPLEATLGDGPLAIFALFCFGVCASNVVLVLFNLIPAFPMDGGRVFRALMALGLGFHRATEVAARVGMVLAFGLGALGLYSHNYMLTVLALFVAFAGKQELLMVRYREKMRLAPRRVLDPHLPLSNAFQSFEPLPVGRAVEVLPPMPTEPRPDQPGLIFHFQVIELPEPPR